MSRNAREISESSIYHIMQRGVGQQILFEDDTDRNYYLGLIGKYVTDCDGEVLAWCLMSNHTHLLVRMEMSSLSHAMKGIGASYARYFNDRYGRSGHLFQGRFHSEVVKDDAQLMTTVRYIHANPLEAGITDCFMYLWSSYASYMGSGQSVLLNKSMVLDIFGGAGEFEKFHLADRSGDTCMDIQPATMGAKLTEEQALQKAREIVGAERIFQLKSMPKKERDAVLRRLKGEGLSARQIMRITGISLGVVGRA